jgi:hypothetical protein
MIGFRAAPSASSSIAMRLKPRAIRVHALVACTAVVLTIGAYLAINYAKFRTFEGVPVRYYALYMKNPRRMQATGGKQIHFSNVRTTAMAYLGPASVEIGAQFPWAYMSTHPRVFPEASIDVVEPHSSIPVSMPALLLLAIVGTRSIVAGRDSQLRSLRLPAISLLLGGSIIFLTVGITERYLHDLYPFLILAAGAGVCQLCNGKGAAMKAAILTPLVVLSIVMNVAFAFDFQREIVWGVPREKREQLDRVRASIDGFLSRPIAGAKEE